jgi:hypothetical protein
MVQLDNNLILNKKVIKVKGNTKGNLKGTYKPSTAHYSHLYQLLHEVV